MPLIMEPRGDIFGYDFTLVITALNYILPVVVLVIFIICYLYFNYQKKRQDKRDDPDTVRPSDRTNIHRLAMGLEDFWRPRIAQKDIIFTVFCDPKIPKKLAIKPITINEMANAMIARSYYKTTTGRIHVHMTYETKDSKKPSLKLIVADTGSGDLTTLSGGHIDKLEIFNVQSLKARAQKIKGQLDYKIRAGYGAEFTLMFPAPPWLPDPKKQPLKPARSLKDLGQVRSENMIEIPLGAQWDENGWGSSLRDRKKPARLHKASPAPKRNPELSRKTEAAIEKTKPEIEPSQSQTEKHALQTPETQGDTPQSADHITLNKSLAEPHAKLMGIDALIVEDVSSNRDVIRALLEPLEQKTIYAHSGAEALKMLKTHIFDYVIMDIHMPDINGIEATQIIRDGNTNLANIPIIALTADSTIAVANDALAAGVDIVLTKPVTASTLFAAIETAISCRDAYHDHVENVRENKRRYL